MPKRATVFGPVGAYFYEVQLAGDTYLYPYEQTTPGLYSGPNAVIAKTIDKELCTHSTFIMWPESDPALHTPWRPMPTELQERLLPAIAKFHEPSIAPWRDFLLRHIGVTGELGGKYGLYDVTIWPLRSLSRCEQ